MKENLIILVILLGAVLGSGAFVLILEKGNEIKAKNDRCELHGGVDVPRIGCLKKELFVELK